MDVVWVAHVVSGEREQRRVVFGMTLGSYHQDPLGAGGKVAGFGWHGRWGGASGAGESGVGMGCKAMSYGKSC